MSSGRRQMDNTFWTAQEKQTLVLTGRPNETLMTVGFVPMVMPYCLHRTKQNLFCVYYFTYE